MWAYRLDPADQFGLLPTTDVVRNKLRAHNGIPPGEVERDIANAKQMARALGWDGTMVDPIRCFIVPGPDSFMVGYMLVQATSNQRFVMSPAPLAFMDDKIDWDARTSMEEVQKTAALLGGKPAERPPIRAADWQVSRKGNMYTQINGAMVTIFPAGNGFKGIISAPKTDRKIFTQVFQTEHDAATHIMQNFYDIVREWGAPSDDYDSNPFAGVDFSAGEDDDIPF